jgi:hypothetical protein
MGIYIITGIHRHGRRRRWFLRGGGMHLASLLARCGVDRVALEVDWLARWSWFDGADEGRCTGNPHHPRESDRRSCRIA